MPSCFCFSSSWYFNKLYINVDYEYCFSTWPPYINYLPLCNLFCVYTYHPLLSEKKSFLSNYSSVTCQGYIVLLISQWCLWVKATNGCSSYLVASIVALYSVIYYHFGVYWARWLTVGLVIETSGSIYFTLVLLISYAFLNGDSVFNWFWHILVIKIFVDLAKTDIRSYF